MACLTAGFRLIWKIIKLVVKFIWWFIKVFLFRFGLICISVYVLGALIIEKTRHIGLSWNGELKIWYFVGLGLSILCTIIIIARRATRGEREAKVNNE